MTEKQTINAHQQKLKGIVQPPSLDPLRSTSPPPFYPISTKQQLTTLKNDLSNNDGIFFAQNTWNTLHPTTALQR